MLRNLGLVTHIEHFALLSLAEGLRRLASSSIQHLQSITLDLFIWLHHNSPSLLMELMDLLEWKILDRRLSNPSYFADLMKLHVRLSLRVDISFLTLTHERDDIKNLSREQLEGTIRKQFEGLFRACLPATSRSGKLGVEFRTILFDPTVKGLEHFSAWNEARPKTDLVSYAFDI
ncbi:hypothetical protein VKT23_000437 [Stygiomarasmius scandens]|uniref:Uncharacterized protein n=1 Tax=Marasmiellus scandens TaxID=2682957 RepID=A0ABR1K533_9AGAR